MKKVVATVEAPAAIGPYSQAISAGGFMFCSGQIPLDPLNGQLIEGDITAQTTRVLENLKGLLHAEGLTLRHVVKTTVFLVDLNDFQAMNDVYSLYFNDMPPARSTIQVAALPRGSRVEVEAIAFAGPTTAAEPLAAPVDYSPASPL